MRCDSALCAALIAVSASATERDHERGAAPSADAGPRDIAEAAPSARQHLTEALRGLRGDPGYGAYLAAECIACHQPDGSDDGIPAITGWPEDDFKAALNAYRIRARDNEAMRLVAGALTDEDIAALAAWFGAQ